MDLGALTSGPAFHFEEKEGKTLLELITNHLWTTDDDNGFHKSQGASSGKGDKKESSGNQNILTATKHLREVKWPNPVLSSSAHAKVQNELMGKLVLFQICLFTEGEELKWGKQLSKT